MSIIYLVISLLCCQSLIYTKPSPSPQIEEAFVTFATSGYFEILKTLLDSIKQFSKRPVIAYGVNDDIPFSQEEYPCLIKRRLDLKPNEHIYFLKPKILFYSNIKYGIYVEADDIVNNNIDDLFTWCRAIKKYPLCPRHAQDPQNQQEVMKALGVTKKSMPYVHGHVLFSYQCKPFIKKWYKNCLKYGWGANYDETVLNVMLWKYNVTTYAPIYDPYYSAIDFFEENEPIPGFQDIQYYMFHGCKIPSEAQDVLQRLIKLAKKNSD